MSLSLEHSYSSSWTYVSRSGCQLRKGNNLFCLSVVELCFSFLSLFLFLFFSYHTSPSAIGFFLSSIISLRNSARNSAQKLCISDYHQMDTDTSCTFCPYWLRLWHKELFAISSLRCFSPIIKQSPHFSNEISWNRKDVQKKIPNSNWKKITYTTKTEG